MKDKDQLIQELVEEFFKDFDLDTLDPDNGNKSLGEFISERLGETESVAGASEPTPPTPAKLIGYDQDGFPIYEL